MAVLTDRPSPEGLTLRAPGRPAMDRAGTRESLVGIVLARVDLAGTDGYDFTASLLAWAAPRSVNGVGVLGPVTAFGLSSCRSPTVTG